jgi:sugar lactone lactonase YvrE
VRVARRALGTGGARGSTITGRALRSGLLAAGLTLALAGAAASSPLSAGRVEPFAGTGGSVGGFAGDGGHASIAELNVPQGLAMDATGNLYIADWANGRVRRVDVHGTITTFAGNPARGYADGGDGGRAKAAPLSPPRWIVAARGNLYLLGGPQDGLHTWVRVVDGAGFIHAFAGTATPGFSGDGGPAVNALLDHPTGLAADSAGNVYIGDRARIRKVSPSGIISTIAGTGTYGFSGDGGPATAARIDSVAALATGTQGDLYLSTGNRVRRIAANGIITTVAGTGSPGFSGDGAPATQARLSTPSALAVDTDGVLFVADVAGNRVRAVTPAGTITTVAGDGKQSGYPMYGLARRASVASPSGLAVDGHGHLFISSLGRNTVLRFTRGLTAEAAGQCTRAAAREIFERQRIGNSGYVSEPVAQLFCGHFAGRHSQTMVASESIPSCGLSTGWFVFRSVRGHWKRVLRVHAGAYLTRSGRTIREWQGVLAPRDAHCFPSSARVRTWHWNGSRLVHSAWQRKPKVPRHLPGLPHY